MIKRGLAVAVTGAMLLLVDARAQSAPEAARPTLTAADESSGTPSSGTHVRPELPVCVYVSSYHQGLAWSDRIEAGLRERLGTSCRLVQFDMDTARHRDVRSAVDAAADAMALISAENPAVVMTSDDNAARYLIVPHLVGSGVPVVFTGVNWTVEEYGFPVENVTGMVEVAPLEPLIEQAVAMVPHARRAAYLAARTLTEGKNFERFSQAAGDRGVELTALQSNDFAQWARQFMVAQSYDFVILGSVDGLQDWDLPAAEALANAHTRTLSVTSHDGMMPLSALGFTTVPEEQGQWAAESAMAILAGTPASSIPIVTNRQWDIWVNEDLLHASGVTTPSALIDSAKRYQTP